MVEYIQLLNKDIELIRALLNLYALLIIVDAVLSHLPQFQDQSWSRKIKFFADFILSPIRKFLPRNWPVDVSPLVAIVLIRLVQLLW